MYIRKSNGPTTEPGGTPNFMVTSFESTPFIETYCLLSDKYDLNQLLAIPLIP